MKIQKQAHDQALQTSKEYSTSLELQVSKYQIKLDILSLLLQLEMACKSQIAALDSPNERLPNRSFSLAALKLQEVSNDFVINLNEKVNQLRELYEDQDQTDVFNGYELLQQDLIQKDVFNINFQQFTQIDDNQMDAENNLKNNSKTLSLSQIFQDSLRINENKELPDRLQSRYMSLILMQSLDLYFAQHRNVVVHIGGGEALMKNIESQINGLYTFVESSYKELGGYVQKQFEAAENYRQLEQVQDSFEEQKKQFAELEQTVQTLTGIQQDLKGKLAKEQLDLLTEKTANNIALKSLASKYIDEFYQFTFTDLDKKKHDTATLAIEEFKKFISNDAKSSKSNNRQIVENFKHIMTKQAINFKETYNKVYERDLDTIWGIEQQNEANIERLKDKVQKYKDQVDEWKRMYKDVQQKLKNEQDAHEKDLLDKNNQISDTMQQLKEITQELQDSQSSFTTLDKKYQDLKLEYENKNKEYKNKLSEQMEKSQIQNETEIDQLTKNLKEAESRAINAEIELNNRKDDIKTQTLAMTEKFINLKAQITNFKTEKEVATIMLKQANEKINKIEGELLTANKLNAELTSQLESSRQLEKQARNSIERLETLNTLNAKRLAAEASRIEKLSQAREVAERDKNRFKADYQLAETQLKNANRQNESLQQLYDRQVQTARQQLEQATKREISLNAELLDKTTQLEKTLMEMQVLQLEKNKYVEDVSSLTYIVTYQHEVEVNLQTTITNLSAENERQAIQMQESLQEIDTLQNAVNSQDYHISEQVQQIQNLTKEIQMNKNVAQNLNQALSKYKDQPVIQDVCTNLQTIEVSKTPIVQQHNLELKEGTVKCTTSNDFKQTIEKSLSADVYIVSEVANNLPVVEKIANNQGETNEELAKNTNFTKDEISGLRSYIPYVEDTILKTKQILETSEGDPLKAIIGVQNVIQTNYNTITYKDNPVRVTEPSNPVNVVQVEGLVNQLFQLYRDLYAQTQISILMANFTVNVDCQIALLNMWSQYNYGDQTPKDFKKEIYLRVSEICTMFSTQDDDLKEESQKNGFVFVKEQLLPGIVTQIMTQLRSEDPTQFLQISNSITGLRQDLTESSTSLFNVTEIIQAAASDLTQIVNQGSSNIVSEESVNQALFDTIVNKPFKAYSDKKAIDAYQNSLDLHVKNFTADHTTGNYRYEKLMYEEQVFDDNKTQKAKIREALNDAVIYMKNAADNLDTTYASGKQTKKNKPIRVFQGEAAQNYFVQGVGGFASNRVLMANTDSRRKLGKNEGGAIVAEENINNMNQQELQPLTNIRNEEQIEDENIADISYQNATVINLRSNQNVAEKILENLQTSQNGLAQKAIPIQHINKLTPEEIKKAYEQYIKTEILANPQVEKLFLRLKPEDQQLLLNRLQIPENYKQLYDQKYKESIKLSPSSQLILNQTNMDESVLKTFNRLQRLYEIFFNFFVTSFSSNYIIFQDHKLETLHPKTSDNAVYFKFQSHADTQNSFHATTTSILQAFKSQSENSNLLLQRANSKAVMNSIQDEKVEQHAESSVKFSLDNLWFGGELSYLNRYIQNQNEDGTDSRARDIYEKVFSDMSMSGTTIFAVNPEYRIAYRILEQQNGKFIEAQFFNKDFNGDPRALFVYDYKKFMYLLRFNPIKLKYLMAATYHQDFLLFLDTELSDEWEYATIREMITTLYFSDNQRIIANGKLDQVTENQSIVVNDKAPPEAVYTKTTMVKFIEQVCKPKNELMADLLLVAYNRKLFRIASINNGKLNNYKQFQKPYKIMFNLFNAFGDDGTLQYREIQPTRNSSNPYVEYIRINSMITILQEMEVIFKDVLTREEIHQINQESARTQQELMDQSTLDSICSSKTNLEFSSQTLEYFRHRNQLKLYKDFTKLPMFAFASTWSALVNTFIYSGLRFWENCEAELDKYLGLIGGPANHKGKNKNERENCMYYQQFKTEVSQLFQREDAGLIVLYRQFFSAIADPQTNILLFLNFIWQRSVPSPFLQIQQNKNLDRFNILIKKYSGILQKSFEKTVSVNLQDLWGVIIFTSKFTDYLNYKPLFFFEIISLFESEKDEVARKNAVTHIQKFNPLFRELPIVLHKNEIGGKGMVQQGHHREYYTKSGYAMEVNATYARLMGTQSKEQLDFYNKFQRSSHGANPVVYISNAKKLDLDYSVASLADTTSLGFGDLVLQGAGNVIEVPINLQKLSKPRKRRNQQHIDSHNIIESQLRPRLGRHYEGQYLEIHNKGFIIEGVGDKGALNVRLRSDFINKKEEGQD